MTEEAKQLYREKKARAAIRSWKTCPLPDLQAAATVFDSAILLVIQRMTLST